MRDDVPILTRLRPDSRGAPAHPAYHCAYCDASFLIVGSEPRRLIVEDTRESLLVAFVCPDCTRDRRDDIEAAERSYRAWLGGAA